MLRRVIETHRAALLVLPFRALCAEKASHLERLLKPLGKYVPLLIESQFVSAR